MALDQLMADTFSNVRKKKPKNENLMVAWRMGAAPVAGIDDIVWTSAEITEMLARGILYVFISSGDRPSVNIAFFYINS